MNEKFEKIVDWILKGQLSEKDIKKAHEQEKKIRETKNVPHHNFVIVTKRKLEEIFSGRVHTKYAREALTALEYANSHYNVVTGASLLDDIVTNQRIVFNNYR